MEQLENRNFVCQKKVTNHMRTLLFWYFLKNILVGQHVYCFTLLRTAILETAQPFSPSLLKSKQVAALGSIRLLHTLQVLFWCITMGHGSHGCLRGVWEMCRLGSFSMRLLGTNVHLSLIQRLFSTRIWTTTILQLHKKEQRSNSRQSRQSRLFGKNLNASTIRNCNRLL